VFEITHARLYKITRRTGSLGAEDSSEGMGAVAESSVVAAFLAGSLGAAVLFCRDADAGIAIVVAIKTNIQFVRIRPSGHASKIFRPNREPDNANEWIVNLVEPSASPKCR
jgi:hypothetical protein